MKGRFMLMRRALLARVPLEIPTFPGLDGLSHREDDLYVSLCVSGGRKDAHLIPARLGKRWREVGRQDARALASQPGHYEHRDRALAAIRAWLNGPTRRHGAHGVRQELEAAVA
jgi:hypothetical protein